jgi:serine/threonine protein kinase
VPIYDPASTPGEPFYAMKLVRGRALDALIAEATTSAARVGLVPHVIAIADALAYAHAVGVIHRDLKPANVLVGDFGETIVIDWGLALEAGAVDPPRADAAPISAPRLTSVGSVIGTPAYMPPEQARGDAVDARADVYALGATLYHVIAGAHPYADAETSVATSDDGPIWARVLDEPPAPLATLCPGVPAELAAIVERAMARRAAARHASAAEVGAALAGFVAHHQSHRLAEAAVRATTSWPSACAGAHRRRRRGCGDLPRRRRRAVRPRAVLQAWPENPVARPAWPGCARACSTSSARSATWPAPPRSPTRYPPTPIAPAC